MELTILIPCLDEARAIDMEYESEMLRDAWRHLRARLTMTVNRSFQPGLNRLRVFMQEPT